MAARAELASARRKPTSPVDRRGQGRDTGATAPVRPILAANVGDLDRLIHDRVRLAIVSVLAVNDAVSFVDLRDMTGTTDGNLSVHARRLEEAGYVSCAKTFAGRTPRTAYRLTAAGRRAFEKYLGHMDALIGAARKARP